MLLDGVVLATMSLMFDLAYDGGFNAFELVFLRGSVSFLAAMVYDFLDKMVTNCNCHDQHKNTSKILTLGNILVDTDLWQTILDISDTDNIKISLWLLMRGFAKMIDIVFFYQSLTLIALGFAGMLSDTTPIWSLFFDKCFIDRQLKFMHYFVTLLGILGIIFVAEPSFIFGHSRDDDDDDTSNNDTVSDQVLGCILATIAAIAQGIAFIAMQKYILHQTNRVQIINGMNSLSNEENKREFDQKINFAGIYSASLQIAIFGVIGSLIFEGGFFNGVTNAITSYYVLIYGLSIGLLGFFGLFLVNFASPKLSTNEMACLSLTSTFFAYVYQILIFNTIPTFYQIIGIGLIFFSMVSLILSNIYDSYYVIVNENSLEIGDGDGNITNDSSLDLAMGE